MTSASNSDVKFKHGDIVRVVNLNGNPDDPDAGVEVTVLGMYRTLMFPELLRDDDPAYITDDDAFYYESELEMVKIWTYSVEPINKI